jgi:hypothetical protein
MTKDERHEICAAMYLSLIVTAFAILFSAGCETPAQSAPAVYDVTTAPSCPCGAACECASLKAEVEHLKNKNKSTQAWLDDVTKQLTAKDAKLAEVQAIASRLESNANGLADELDAVKYAEPVPVKVNGSWYKSHEGETVRYDAAANIWRYVKQAAMKPESVQAPDPYMSPCGPGGCPTPSARGFRLFR